MSFRPSSKQILNSVILSVLTILGLIIFKDQLSYGLAGDENRALLLLRSNFLVVNLNSFRNLIPYGGSPIIMLIILQIFGYTPVWFYLSSLILRVAASFSVYLLGNNLFKSKTIGIIASILFMSSYVGSETSAPANMGTYMSIALINIGFVYLFKFFDNKNKQFDKGAGNLVKTFILFFFAFIFNVVRMHGLVVLFFLLITIATLLKIIKIKQSIVFLICFGLILLFAKCLGFIGSAGTSAEVAKSLLSIDYLAKIPNLLKTIYYLFVSFYQMLFIPETNPIHLLFVNIFSNMNINNLSVLILLMGPSILISIAMFRKLKNNKLVMLMPTVIWFIYLQTLANIFKTRLYGDNGEGVAMLIGGAIIILIGRLILFTLLSDKVKALKIIFITLWPFCFILVSTLMWPGQVNYTFSRYLTVSMVGICILIPFLMLESLSFISTHLNRNKKIALIYKNIKYPALLILFMIIIINNAKMTKAHFYNDGERGLNKKYIDYAYNIINDELGNRANKSRALVTIQSDNSDFSMLSIAEGGEERFSLIHNNVGENIRPYFVPNQNDLIAIYCEHKYGLKPKIEDIFSFSMVNKQLTSLTNQTRLELLTLSKDKNRCPQTEVIVPVQRSSK